MGKSIALALLKHGAEVVILEKLKDDLMKFKEEVRLGHMPAIVII